jgi:hypothetical protein
MKVPVVHHLPQHGHEFCEPLQTARLRCAYLRLDKLHRFTLRHTVSRCHGVTILPPGDVSRNNAQSHAGQSLAQAGQSFLSLSNSY